MAIFKYFFNKLDICTYDNTKIGDSFDTFKHISISNTGRTISSVILNGYVDKNTNTMIKKSIVMTSR